MSQPDAISRRGAISIYDILNVSEHSRGAVVEEILCERCAAIDFSIFESGRDIDDRDGVFLQDLGMITEADKGSSCPLCRFLATMRMPCRTSFTSPSNKSVFMDDEHELRAYSSLFTYHGVTSSTLRRRLAGQNRVLLGVVHRDDILLEDPRNVGFFGSTPLSKVERQIEEQESFGPRIIFSKINFNLLTNWLNFCSKFHSYCDHERIEYNVSRRQGKEVQTVLTERGLMFTDGEASFKPAWPAALRLIDCYRRQVVRLGETCDYVALSYVWGKPRENEEVLRPRIKFGDSRKMPLPELVPQTIQDAIEAVKQLGMRYLWVDQYCIDQQDNQSKHKQIQQMHLIYKCAHTTIVAAYGSDAHAGLPGMSVPRDDQPQIALKSRHLVSTMSDPQEEVKDSTWFTRGWTYQEGVFSGRRLIWTKNQIYFECNGMNICEAACKPLLPLHVNEKTAFRSGIRPSIFQSPREPTDSLLLLQKFDWSKGWSSWIHGYKARILVSYEYPSGDLLSFQTHLEQYTARRLRYSSDSLNAFTGILSTFSDLGYSISHYWGVPVGKEYTSSLQRCLSWYHVMSNSEPPRRRKQFPSWSWAGWSGAIRLDSWGPLRESDKARHLNQPKFRVSSSTRSGEKLRRLRTPTDALKLTQRGEDRHMLFVSTHLAQIKLIYLSSLEDLLSKGHSTNLCSDTRKHLRRRGSHFEPGFYWAETRDQTSLAKADLSVLAPDNSRQKALLLFKPCLGVCLGYNGDGRHNIMLIQQLDNRTFERIGHIGIVWWMLSQKRNKIHRVKRSKTGRYIIRLA